MGCDAKDIFLANKLSPTGYSIRYRTGEVNYRKFTSVIPYSLDLIKLKDVYERAYRRIDFSWFDNGKEYTSRVINLTFKFSVKTYNVLRNNLYLAFGHSFVEADLKDCVCVQNGKLIAIQLGQQVDTPICADLLGKSFYYDVDKRQYKLRSTPPTLYTVAQLRQEIYENGFMCDGIKYVRFKRSSGSARVGKCLFIDEALYSRMHKWDLCGLKIRNGDLIDIAAFESYISLTSSSIIDTLQIEPHNILLIDDYTSVFKDDAVATSLGADGKLVTEHKVVEIQNNIWDGQSLLQTEVFGEYKDKGFLLLRNRFFKSACFNCDIQKFFADNGVTEICQLNGRTRAERIKDIKLITTPSSLKYLKFGEFDAWLDNIDATFGIVKYEKPTHHFGGRLVQTHYQLINTLQLSQQEVRELLAPSIEFLKLLKTNPAVLRYYIGFPEDYVPYFTDIMSKSDIVYRLMGINNRFTRTNLYADFRNDLVKSVQRNLRKGKILVNGTYTTMCGNPIEMLRHSIYMFNGESQIGIGNVHNVRFPYGAQLLGSRSPHVAISNVWLTINSENKEIDKYLHPTDEILYVNSIGENLLERLSGADFDSDTVLLTDDTLLISAAKRNYNNFAVPTCLVSAIKTSRPYTNSELCTLDIQTSVNKIGEIINCSQELNSRLWDMVNRGTSATSEKVQALYCDIARLDTMSGLEIDKAKRIIPVDNVAELAMLKQKYQCRDKDNRVIKPNFFAAIAREKGYYNNKRNNYKKHKTAMDYVQDVLNKCRLPRDTSEYLPFSSILDCGDFDITSVRFRQINKIVDMGRDMCREIRSIWADSETENKIKYDLADIVRTQTLNAIGKIKMNRHTAYQILKIIEKEKYSDIANQLFTLLFQTPNKSIFDAIIQCQEPVPVLREDENGDIELYHSMHRIE